MLVTVYVVAQPVSNVESIMIHLVIMYCNVFMVKLQENRLTTLARRPFRIALGYAQKFFRSRFAGLGNLWLAKII